VLFGLVYVTVGLGTTAGALETALTVSGSDSLAAPAEIPLKGTTCCPASTFSAISFSAFNVGGWFTGLRTP